MPFDPVTFGAVAGASVLAPFISKGLGSLFGLDEPSAQEREAAALRQQAIARMTEQAEGRTASPAQLAAIAQQQRTQQALQSLAQRGTVQQRAGNVRAAMQAAPEVMAQQGATAAQTRAAEMESARRALVQLQTGIASEQAAAGREQRRYTQGLIGAGVQGAATAVAMGMKADEPPSPRGPGGGGGGDGSQPAAGGDFLGQSRQLEIGSEYQKPSLSFGPEASEALTNAGFPGARAGDMRLRLDQSLRGTEYDGARGRGMSPYGAPSFKMQSLQLGGR